MRIPNLGEIELLVPLHDGMFEQPMWQTFLQRLCAATGADYASLVLRLPDGKDMLELSSGASESVQVSRIFAEKYGRDPLANRSMREGRVYALGELVEMGGAVEREFVTDVLAPLGLVDLRAVRVEEAHGLLGWISISSRQPIAVTAGSLLTALAPHLRTALRCFAALELERSRSSVGAELFRRMNFGWISLDQTCRIVDCNEQAERLMGRTGLLTRGRYDRLLPGSASIDRELSRLVRHFAAHPEAAPGAINLSRDPWTDMLVAPVRERGSAAAAPVAIVYLSGDRTSTADRCDQIAALFGLSPSEARLAWAMTQGMSISDAAGHLGLTTETARYYSKAIYAKTGARGQTDLVRFILTSVLAVA